MGDAELLLFHHSYFNAMLLWDTRHLALFSVHAIKINLFSYEGSVTITEVSKALV